MYDERRKAFDQDTPCLNIYLVSFFLCAVPVVPESPSEAITYNSSTASVWFDLWGSGGCDILYYTIEWKQPNSNEWISKGKPVTPSERMYSVGGLEPATKYQLKVTAHNNIGLSNALYNFTTLTIDGGKPMGATRFSTEKITGLSIFIHRRCDAINFQKKFVFSKKEQ